MKRVDNLDRHKISDEFEFRPHRTIDSRVTYPFEPEKKKHIRPCAEHSLATLLYLLWSYTRLIADSFGRM